MSPGEDRSLAALAGQSLSSATVNHDRWQTLIREEIVFLVVLWFGDDLLTGSCEWFGIQIFLGCGPPTTREARALMTCRAWCLLIKAWINKLGVL